jgi:hypothetical protein
MKVDNETTSEILGILERFKEANVKRELSAMLKLFAKQSDVYLMGSEAGETATGPIELRAFFERLFSRPVIYDFEWKSHSISKRDNVAWVRIDALVHVRGEVEETKPYRITAVFEKSELGWVIMQYHGSEPSSKFKV